MPVDQEYYRDDSWWWSKLEDYRKCLHFGKLRHIEKTVGTSLSLDTEFGSAMHLAINDVLSGGEGQRIFDIAFGLCKNSDLQRFKYGWEALNDMAPVFLRKFKKLHAKKFKPVSMEDRMSAEFEGEILEGTPDFLGYYDDVASGVDFKTSGSKYLPQAIQSHGQIPFYAYLSSKRLDFLPKQRILYVLVKDFHDPSIQVLKSPLTSTELYSTMLNTKAEIQHFKNRTEYPKNPSACVRGPIVCPAFDICWPKGEEKK